MEQDDSDQLREDIGTKAHLKWQSEDQLKTSGSFYTDKRQYTGDGYVIDFSLGMSSQEFKRKIAEYEIFEGDEKFIDY